MLERLLPRQVDNTYTGYRLALWLLALVVLVKGGIGLGTMFNGHNAAITADGIPLDTFTAMGQQAFIALFAAWGLAQLLFNLTGVLVLVRYRSLVPFMFTLLLLEHLARKLIFWLLPLPRVGVAPGVWVNLILVAIMIVGLALSLGTRKGAEHGVSP